MDREKIYNKNIYKKIKKYNTPTLPEKNLWEPPLQGGAVNEGVFMNQRIIKIKKNALMGEYVDLFLLWTAHADLYNCLNAFIMWMYFATIKEEEEIPMRQQYICSLTSMSVSSYKRAFKKLKDKGYLKKEGKENNYTFSATAFERIVPHSPEEFYPIPHTEV